MHLGSSFHRLGWLFAAALAVFVVASLAGVVRGGPLDPPNAPSSTLPQVEPRIPIRQPASFPITISQSGSYFLVENITSTAAANGVLISADNVTLDLNGFTLTGSPVGGAGITATGGSNVTVTNGVIRGWGGAGINLSAIATARYERLHVTDNDGGGIIAGKNSLITDCMVTDNGGNGIAVVQPLTSGSSIVSGCVVDGSVLDGIVVDNNVTVTGNTVTNSGVDGIHATQSGNRIDSNNLKANVSLEIHVDAAGNTIVRNSFSGGDSDLAIAIGNSKGPTENAGTPLSNPWANIGY